MLSTSIPAKFPIPFAANATPADIRPIPTASQILSTPGAASLNDGFPPLNFAPVGSGGIPPFGQDVNGILNEITTWIQWSNAAGPIGYDATFSTAVGGYPKSALLTAAAGGWWLSSVENNTSDPDTGGAGWEYISFGQTYAGNPNGYVAGVSAASGAVTSSLLWDSTNLILWVCSGTGTATTAVWVESSSVPTDFWCGTSSGTGNAQRVATTMQSFPTGTGISWKVGASQSNAGATSLTVGTFGTFPLYRDTPSGPQQLVGGELIAGSMASGRFDGAAIHLTTRIVPGLVGGTGLTVGHLARFTDTLGTLSDGGVMGVANSSTYLTVANNAQTFGYGSYNTDTSGGAFIISLPLAPILGESLVIKDIAGTWGINNLTINPNGGTIMGSTSNLICNVSGEAFTIWYNGTDWRLE